LRWLVQHDSQDSGESQLCVSPHIVNTRLQHLRQKLGAQAVARLCTALTL